MFTKKEFVKFCTLFEKENSRLKYDADKLEETETGYEYEVNFKDEYNYQIPLKLYFDNGVIHWEVPEFRDDEKEDTEPLFHEWMKELYETFENEVENHV